MYTARYLRTCIHPLEFFMDMDMGFDDFNAAPTGGHEPFLCVPQNILQHATFTMDPRS